MPRNKKTCAPDFFSYVADVLQRGKHRLRPPAKSALAVLLIGLVLLLNAMSACPALHELIHKDADSSEHHCAVTLFAHGQVDSVAVEVSVAAPTFSTAVPPQIIFSFFAPAIENLPAGRAPPALPAVS